MTNVRKAASPHTGTTSEDSVRKELRRRRDALQASLGREVRRADDMRAAQLEQAVSDRIEVVDQRVANRSRALEQDNIDRHRAELRLVEEALDRLDDGTYGLCMQCAEPISAGRLEVESAARLCIDCQHEEELAPPAGG